MKIKNTLAKILLVFIISISVIMPIISFAAQSGNSTVSYSAPSLWPKGFWGPIVWCTGSSMPSANPTPSPTPGTAGQTPPTCNNLCDLIGVFINIVYLLMSIAIFAVAPISVVTGGVMIMLAGANPGMLENGKKVLTGAVIGLIIVLCSYLIVNTVLWALSIVSVGGFNGNSFTCSISP
jgi:hypothetical protein